MCVEGSCVCARADDCGGDWMLSSQAGAQQRDQLLAQLMALPNGAWQDIMFSERFQFFGSELLMSFGNMEIINMLKHK